ncbi:DUF6993 domain-containing protein [Sinomonas susongensis]|uniref:DUF6993 domain-containing protein n=1 Tax=Sinomonas susongensis TaxID=1324851 RepID=UPI0011090677|nr:hypothetical protein [Sinomonas susongensis]
MRNFLWGGIVVVLLAVGGFGLTGALQGLDFSPAPAASAAPSSAPSVSAPPPATAAPAASTPTAGSLARFDPSAPDESNLDLFKRTLEKAAQTTASSVQAKTLTDALTAVGFQGSAMQQSADQTSANLQAPTLMVSVRVGAQCLIGQFVRSDGSISAQIAAPIQTGACLIGRQSAVS